MKHNPSGGVTWWGWSVPVRMIVFALSATSIWCLLAEFYNLCSMRAFTLFISLPSMTLLAVMVFADGSWGDGRVAQAITVGYVAGLIAAVAYDLFRLPFVFAREWGISSVVPPLKLFKVFPHIGAMILGEPTAQASYSPAAHLVGWAYHFSNGLTFGVMFTAMIGDSRRPWGWAVVMAVGLELWMLLSPYPDFFGIRVGPAFVATTLAAHLVFGVVLGLVVRWVWPSKAVGIATG
jgi:hypothetical protein